MNYWTLPGIDKQKSIQVDKLFELIHKHMQVSKEQLKSKTRLRDFVEARYIFAYIVKNQTNLSWRLIGEYINRDHSTTIYYVKQANWFLKTDKRLNKLYSQILSSL